MTKPITRARHPRDPMAGGDHPPGAIDRMLAIGLDWALVPLFLLFFTTRLVPQPWSDRSLYQSVAERLLAGDLLYVDVIDNKDPLFYYAVAVQRMLGPLAEYGFELVCAVGSALVVAGLARRCYPDSRAGRRLAFLLSAFMLTGRFYDRGGSIPPGIALALLTIGLGVARRGLPSGVALAVLLFAKLIYAPIALTFVVVHALAEPAGRQDLRRFLQRMALGCIVASAAALMLLAARGEWSGYLEAQRANLFYSSSNVFAAPILLESLKDHALTALYFGTPLLLLSLVVCVLLVVRYRREPVGGVRRPYLAACLACYPICLAVIALTAIWGPHLAVLHIFLAAAAAVLVPSLLTASHQPIGLAAILGAGLLLTGPGPDDALLSDPLDFPDRLADLTDAPPEAVALHQIAGPGPVRYARLGSDNDWHHASGTRADRLVCPRFFQYRFTAPPVLDSILACAARADYLIVDFPADRPLAPGTFVTPVADYGELNRRWAGFTTSAEALLRARFRCVSRGDTLRICRRIDLAPAGAKVRASSGT